MGKMLKLSSWLVNNQNYPQMHSTKKQTKEQNPTILPVILFLYGHQSYLWFQTPLFSEVSWKTHQSRYEIFDSHRELQFRMMLHASNFFPGLPHMAIFIFKVFLFGS